MAALAPISTPIGRRCRRGRLASLTRGELALIEWLKLDDRCSVIAAYPERHGARIAAAGWSEGRKLPGRGALCDRHGAEAKLVRELSSPQWSDARRPRTSRSTPLSPASHPFAGPILKVGFGSSLHASEGDPQYEIKSDMTDHVAMHKGGVLRLLRR